MSDNKNIDRLFQEKFKDFETAPSNAVWKRISNSLQKTKPKQRRVIPLWWQIGGIAATLALLLTIGFSVYNNDDTPVNNLPVVNTEKETIENVTNSLKDLEKNILNTTDVKDNIVVETKQAKSENTTNTARSKTPQKNNTSNTYSSNQKLKTNSVIAENSKENTSSEKSSSIKSSSNINTTVTANTTEKTNTESNTPNPLIINKNQLSSELEETIKDQKGNVVVNTEAVEDEVLEANPILTQTEKSDALVKTDASKESIEDAIANTKPILKTEDEKQSRWSIAPNVAPVYFNSLGEGSSIDAQFNNNEKRSAITMSYGITGSYKVSDKLKIRAGINRVDIGQTTSDVVTFDSRETIALNSDNQTSNISFTNNSNSISMVSSSAFNSAPEAFATSLTGDIDQRYGFIEVPLELEYRLLDKKFGIDIIGGFSTLFLNDNEIFADINGVSTLVGESNNISSTSFSANFGIGLDYSITKQWSINVEPIFKYQLNTFNNTSGNFNPYFIGVYSGLSFKF